MKRISTDMPNNDMQYYMRRKEALLSRMQGKIAGQSRIQNLRDDPVAAAHSVVLKSNISRLRQFSDNTGEIQSRGRVVEGYIQESLSIMHRLNEIAVQGANGTYKKEETAMMGDEVNQLLNELVQISNSRHGDGTSLFSGDRSLSLAFRPVEGYVEGSGRKLITNVEYTGTINPGMGEISDNSYVESGFPGNTLFWAEQQIVISSRNSDNFFVRNDSSVLIDGVKVDFKSGDNIHAVIAKINDSGAPVKASLDPVKSSLTLSTTEPHQIWIEDAEGGTVFQETGLVKAANTRPPHNIAPDARISGGSLFDMAIKLRDSLYTGNVIDIGSSSLKGIQDGLNHLVSQAGKLGARDERLELVKGRLAYQIPEITAMDSRETDIDLAEAITELKMLEFTHKASLQTAARILKPTLLDFLR
ncbi:MAG: flagellar hook-associated protein 3 [Spirochaetia bacterium]|jgi:flagellar hook-associated protein 3 FlgL|nr:flagellar hook-associated protein 3 [Spirochaetia bacterium]